MNFLHLNRFFLSFFLPARRLEDICLASWRSKWPISSCTDSFSFKPLTLIPTSPLPICCQFDEIRVPTGDYVSFFLLLKHVCKCSSIGQNDDCRCCMKKQFSIDLCSFKSLLLRFSHFFAHPVPPGDIPRVAKSSFSDYNTDEDGLRSRRSGSLLWPMMDGQYLAIGRCTEH